MLLPIALIHGWGGHLKLCTMWYSDWMTEQPAAARRITRGANEYVFFSITMKGREKSEYPFQGEQKLERKTKNPAKKLFSNRNFFVVGG